jgi:hypothetical protein
MTLSFHFYAHGIPQVAASIIDSLRQASHRPLTYGVLLRSLGLPPCSQLAPRCIEQKAE